MSFRVAVSHLIRLLPALLLAAFLLPAPTATFAQTEPELAAPEAPLVIAHRGASGYLPEHTLEAKAAAYAMGADYIEQDVVLTKDDVPVVLHDIHLDTATDVAEKFPGRARDDGRYYVVDFTLDEIKQLNATERFELKSGEAVFPGRFPVGKSSFQVPTLAEEIELIQGLNRSMGREVGIYPEIKAPAFHRAEGKDISKIVIETLHDHGYPDEHPKVFLQCFDPAELTRIDTEIETDLPLVQLIGLNIWREADTDYTQMVTREGLERVAEYAVGIGPSIDHIYRGMDETGQPRYTDLVADAHALGLKVHPYTVRTDALPRGVADAEQIHRMLLVDQNVDGFFTDFPDVGVGFVHLFDLAPAR